MWSCLQPHLCAGGPSMMMFTHRICMALRGLGRLHTVDRVMRLRAAMLLQGKGNRQPPSVRAPHAAPAHYRGPAASAYVLSWKRTKFLML